MKRAADDTDLSVKSQDDIKKATAVSSKKSKARAQAAAAAVDIDIDAAEEPKKEKKAAKPAGDPYPRDSVRPKALPGSGAFVKVLSWNVAGLRGTLKKKPTILSDLARTHMPDIICLQETKLQESNVPDLSELLKPEGYSAHWTCSTKKAGYSGNVVFIKAKTCGQLGSSSDAAKPKQASLTSFFSAAKDPSSSSSSSSSGVLSLQGVKFEFDETNFSGEGRTVTVEFDKFFLVACYVPNSGQKLERLGYRVEEWDPHMRCYLKSLNEKKPVVFAGDLNCGFGDLDIYNFEAKHISKQAGLTPEERLSFGQMLSEGFFDSFRHMHPDAKGQFTYWSQRTFARPVNNGIRLDYFICSDDMKQGSVKVFDSYMLPHDTEGVSDHCPVCLVLSV